MTILMFIIFTCSNQTDERIPDTMVSASMKELNEVEGIK